MLVLKVLLVCLRSVVSVSRALLFVVTVRRRIVDEAGNVTN
jgi:hypothetical protein